MNNQTPIFKLDLIINKDDKGCVTDIVLKPQEQGEAEWFCTGFDRAVNNGTAGLYLVENGILFYNDECPFQPAEKIFPLKEDDLKKVKTFLKMENLVAQKQSMGPKRFGIKIFQH